MRGERPRTFRILTVCTGNQCRSPAVERMLGHLLIRDRVSRFEVESAGTLGPAGAAMHPITRVTLARRGVRGESHVAQLLDGAALERACLVLTAERSHRARVVDLAPWAAPITFTVLEFARLATAAMRLGVMSPDELVAAAATLRSQIPRTAPALDDIPDPVHGLVDDHEAMLDTVQRAVVAIVDALTTSAEPPIDLCPKGRRALAW